MYSYPERALIFNVFRLCRPEKVRVLILGQDPYQSKIKNTDVPAACGVAFATPKGAKVQDSLKNIYKEIANSVPGFRIPNHGDLSRWCAQGIFAINTCLTVRPGISASHGKVWHAFIVKIIRALEQINPEIIFLSWGNKSKAVLDKIKLKSPYILQAAHPSPMSAYDGFFGCNHFVKVNEILTSKGQKPINWQL